MGNFELDWEYLPELCLFTVLDKLDGPINLVQFGAVSRHWHSVFNMFLDIKRRSLTNLIPVLLIPTKKSNKKRRLCCLQARAKVSRIEFPKPYTWRCCGSCYGWLATLSKNLIITLSNPFKDTISIDLPRLDHDITELDNTHYQYKIRKVVLSNDPLLHPNNYVVVVIYSVYCRLAFYKSWQKDWIYIDKDQSLFADAIFYRNLVYVIGHYNSFVSFDVNGVEDDENLKSSKLNLLMPEDRRLEAYSYQVYLVKSSMGNLYSIHKHLDQDFAATFKVFKLVLDDENGKLLEKKEVKSMDGDIVFVGDNGTLAVSALDFLEGQPNSIYFSDNHFGIDPYEPLDSQDINIFHLKDGSFEKYC